MNDVCKCCIGMTVHNSVTCCECKRVVVNPVIAERDSAVKLIMSIAQGRDAFDTQAELDNWLDQNGYECRASQKRKSRLTELDVLIADLITERNELLKITNSTVR